MLYKIIEKCRICESTKFEQIIHLGDQALTGVFPLPNETVEAGPLELVRCVSDGGTQSCGLVQLRHNYDLEKLYGDNYGYRSGLNNSMVRHLHGIVEEITKRVALKPGDLIIDIAGNDSTLLQAYDKELKLISIDPTAEKFKSFYPEHISYINDFFSSEIVHRQIGRKAKVVTSIAMFYDLAHPISFMKQIYEILEDDGIWVLEQSYMPTMIDNVSYDTICHEHLEYYSLRQIKWMTDRAGLKIIDISFNNANGGSFRVTVAKDTSPYAENSELVNKILHDEEIGGFSTGAVYDRFKKHVEEHRDALVAKLKQIRAEGKIVYGYGASTKGNVILQYCHLTKMEIPYIAEVNEYKFGRVTPGTRIPIISEAEAKKNKPDYFLVLPWHFKDNIVGREKDWLASGGHLFFPLPKPEII